MAGGSSGGHGFGGSQKKNYSKPVRKNDQVMQNIRPAEPKRKMMQKMELQKIESTQPKQSQQETQRRNSQWEEEFRNRVQRNRQSQQDTQRRNTKTQQDMEKRKRKW